MTDRPNILIILTDQQSASMMSCAGNTDLQTPAMDSLADRGVRFNRAYCTNPVCIASRFSLMTGRMPSDIGMYSNSTSELFPLSQEQLQQSLGWQMQRAGYRTVYGGKVHLPRMPLSAVGFENISNDERDDLAETCSQFLLNSPPEPFCMVASFVNPHDICYMAIRDSIRNESERDLIARGAVECRTLDEALERPAGVSEEEFFRDHCPQLPPNFEPQEDEPEIISLMLQGRPFRRNVRENWSAKRWREHRWAYARLTERVDAQIGRLLQALDESGLAYRTLVILTSDHGDMDAAHRLEHKSTLYEQACRIPFIICPPGGSSGGGRVDEHHLVSNGLDLLPTACDYAGVDVPEELRGQSIRPLLEGHGQAPWRHVLPVESAIGRMVVADRFKYAAYDLSENWEHLIDLQEDPGEMRSVAGDPKNRAVLEDLRAEFEREFAASRHDEEAIAKALPNG